MKWRKINLLLQLNFPQNSIFFNTLFFVLLFPSISELIFDFYKLSKFLKADTFYRIDFVFIFYFYFVFFVNYIFLFFTRIWFHKTWNIVFSTWNQFKFHNTLHYLTWTLPQVFKLWSCNYKWINLQFFINPVFGYQSF